MLLQFAFTGVCDENQVKHLVSYKRCQSTKSRAEQVSKELPNIQQMEEGAR